jgi:hypothetical protein
MKKLSICLTVFAFIFSQLSHADPTVELIFTGTTGTGTPGTDTIRAKAGDELTLDVMVTDNDSQGICFAYLGLSWDAGLLTGSNAAICPLPPNSTAGTCNDSDGNNWLQHAAPIESAGSVEFRALDLCALGGLPYTFVDQSMTLGRTQLLVVDQGTSEIVVEYPEAGDWIRAGGGDTTDYKPTATATVLPPPAGC